VREISAIFSSFLLFIKISLDTNKGLTRIDIENQAYEILLEYMESKSNMQVGNIKLLHYYHYYAFF
jgi:hypothetical protein